MTATAPEQASSAVRGQHRNRALAAWRQGRAVELAAQMCTYETIARTVGYANRGTAYRVVQSVLDAARRQTVVIRPTGD